MEGQSPLDRLATRAGIALSYYNLSGDLQVIDDDAKRALLAAMGYDAGTDAGISEALAGLDRGDGRPLPPVVIATLGDNPVSVPVLHPASLPAGPVDWTVVTETDETHSGRASSDGHDRSAVSLSFDEPLPAGYHMVTLDLPTGAVTTSLIVAPPRAFGLSDLDCPDRVWGVATPLYGLRSARNWGIGDFADLDAFAETVAEAGAALVGINPVHALFPSQPERFSPYSPSSRLYHNPLHIALDAVPIDGADDPGPAQTLAALRAAKLLDYSAVAALKTERLEALYRRFKSGATVESDIRASFEIYVRNEGVALYRHALFEALSERFRAPAYQRWQEWPAPYRSPDTPEVDAFAANHEDRIEYAMFLQWLAAYQLAAVQERARARGMPIGLYGDLAVGVDPGGADVWAAQETYAHGVSLGAPPDQFSPTGQEWGLAPLLPGALYDAAYSPFVSVLQRAMQYTGALRIDHALGLERCFWAPAGGAAAGSYVQYPANDLLAIIRLESHRNRCIVIGEDLGNVPPTLRHALGESGLLGYRVFAFERDGDGSFRSGGAYQHGTLASATTHDLPTSRGYWNGRDIDWRVRVGHLDEAGAEGAQDERAQARRWILRRLAAEGLLPDGLNPEDPPGKMQQAVLEAIHRFLATTPAAIAMVQYEDMVGEVEQANLPGTVEEHPNWRRRPGPPLEDLAATQDWRRLAAVMAEARGGGLS